MYKTYIFRTGLIKNICCIFAAIITIIICIFPMSRLPLWNGEKPDHRNQYELMAEAVLDGRIDFNYGDEDELKKLQNPYDPDERKESGVKYHWDHAYYNGHYYMYFGIVPVLLVFLPYRLITGTALTTFHATQLFTVAIIAGIFLLFRMLSELFFKKLPFAVYLLLSAAFSVMSVWYASAEPALYCTAITSAIALEVWSLYFFIRAVYLEKNENKQIVLAGTGALLGALTFGCRPPVALANIIVIPLLAVFLKDRVIDKKLIGKLAAAAAPYLVVAICLMIYNYVRFDSPFEFGQAYQLTSADQSNYGKALNGVTLLRLITEIEGNFFAFTGMTEAFPYIYTSSVFFNFPILLLSIVSFFPQVYIKAKETRAFPVLIGLMISVIIITAMDVLWSPYLLERYRMDIYFLMGIECFMALGFLYEESGHKIWLSILIIILAIRTIFCSFLFFVRTVSVYYPEVLTDIAKLLGL